MEELSVRVKLLTVEHLHVVVRALIEKNPSHAFVKYGLATEVLRFFFGNNWTNQNAFSNHTEVDRRHRSGRMFLKTDNDSADDAFLHQQRVFDLAELVFNLQPVSGIRDRIIRLQREDLESAFGELDCTSLVA